MATETFFESFAVPSALDLSLDDPLPTSVWLSRSRRARLRVQRSARTGLSSPLSASMMVDRQRRLFRKISLPGADVFLLDVRQYRDVPIAAAPESAMPVRPLGVSTNFTCVGKYSSPDLCKLFPGPHGSEKDVFRGSAAAGRTMLGDVQLQWLKNGLLDSQKSGNVKVIVSPVFMFQAFLSPEEAWQGYWGERQRLLRFIEGNGIDKVLFLSSGVLGSVITRISANSNNEMTVYEMTVGATGQLTAGTKVGKGERTKGFEEFVRQFAENGHLTEEEEKKPVSFVRMDKPSFVGVEVKEGKLTAECVGEDGDVLVDRAGKMCRLTIG